MATSKVKPSIEGLNQALAPNVEDPLGTNLKRQGMDAYYDEARKSDPRYASGPLPDPAWEGLLQALSNNGVSKVGMDAARPHGIADTPEFTASGDVGALSPGPVNPNKLNGQDLENYRLMRSNNIATPGVMKPRQ